MTSLVRSKASDQSRMHVSMFEDFIKAKYMQKSEEDKICSSMDCLLVNDLIQYIHVQLDLRKLQ